MKLWLKLNILPYIIFIFHRLLSWTWRLKIVYPPGLLEDFKNQKPIIFAHWHSDETVLVVNIREMNAGVLNSKSSDGQMMARVVKLYGAKTAKGSSSRSGVGGLKGLVRLTKEGRNPAIAVDGPRGPYREIKSGVFQLSRLSGARIYPSSVQYSSAWHFPKSWDKTYLPKPFARVLIYWGEALPVVTKDDDPKGPELDSALQARFARAEDQATHFFAEMNSK